MSPVFIVVGDVLFCSCCSGAFVLFSDVARIVTLLKQNSETEFGFHLWGSKPVLISTVEAGELECYYYAIQCCFLGVYMFLC